MKAPPRFDEVGYWSEIKLAIVKEYAAAYSRVLAAQTKPRLSHVYIDAFAGPGIVVRKGTNEPLPGSPVNALRIKPPFKSYHFIDLNRERVDVLSSFVGSRPDAHVHHGDCNKILIEDVFPQVRYDDYRRGLCLLDPYGLHLDWRVIETAGKMGSIEMFLNFPVADMNRNVLWRNPEGVAPEDIERMNAFWGDDSWRGVAYNTAENLFGFEMKESNDTIAAGFRKRLRVVAGFRQVPPPIPMRNHQGAVVYYLFFASQKPVAGEIVDAIFEKYRMRGNV